LVLRRGEKFFARLGVKDRGVAAPLAAFLFVSQQKGSEKMALSAALGMSVAGFQLCQWSL
jgi:hypothetical protein